MPLKKKSLKASEVLSRYVEGDGEIIDLEEIRREVFDRIEFGWYDFRSLF